MPASAARRASTRASARISSARSISHGWCSPTQTLLDTLPPREFRAGYAEMAKHGLIGNAEYFAWLEAHREEIFAGGPGAHPAIAESVRVQGAHRRRRRARDWRSRPSQPWPHLRARARSRLRIRQRTPDPRRGGRDRRRARARILRRAKGSRRQPTPSACAAISQTPGCRPRSPTFRAARFRPTSWCEHMAQDKKVKGGRLTFILTRGIGQAFIANDVPAGESARRS